MIKNIFKAVLMGLGGLMALLITIAIFADLPEAPPSASQPAAVAPVTVTPVASTPVTPARPAPPSLPADQQGFVAAVAKAAADYAAGANEMAKGATRPQRAKAICAVMKALTIRDWIGTVETLSSNSDGKGVLAVRVSREATMKTWNNAVSDTGDRTLIEPGSPVFQAAVAMRRGATVRFSGTVFRSDVDCVKEASVTISGSMRDPEFILRFTAISAVE